MRKIAMHWQILIGMGLGVIFGLLFSYLGMGAFVKDWIKPFGTIFMQLLKLIAVPLVLASLIKGVADLKDISKLSRIGSRTVMIYLGTTVLAVTLGLIMVNLFEPGLSFSPEKRMEFQAMFGEMASEKSAQALNVKEQGPLQPLVDMVSGNIFSSITDNSRMLQVIFFALLFGVAMVLIEPEKAEPVKAFFDGVNDIIIKIVEIIMYSAPYGVFALLAGLIIDFAGDNPQQALELFSVLGYYGLVVLLGLAFMAFVVYPTLLKIFTGQSYGAFFSAISPAQYLAFSTSSSAATLSVTMDCVQNRLGVSKEVSSFVLPLGATINMDGTSLYQAVAAVFIAQAFGFDLTLEAQLGIITTATLASIGSAAVPGAGIIMLVIVLEQAGLPTEGVALIFAVDRLLDMCRTVVNVTGDATVATLVAQGEKK